jgi:hypothetical protein
MDGAPCHLGLCSPRTVPAGLGLRMTDLFVPAQTQIVRMNAPHMRHLQSYCTWASLAYAHCSSDGYINPH